MAIEAVKCVEVDMGNGKKEIDVKKYAKIEKVPGGTIEECRVLKGVMFNKDVVVSGAMTPLPPFEAPDVGLYRSNETDD